MVSLERRYLLQKNLSTDVLALPGLFLYVVVYGLTYRNWMYLKRNWTKFALAWCRETLHIHDIGISVRNYCKWNLATGCILRGCWEQNPCKECYSERRSFWHLHSPNARKKSSRLSWASVGVPRTPDLLSLQHKYMKLLKSRKLRPWI